MESLTAFSLGGRLPLRLDSSPRQPRRLSYSRLRTRAAREGPELDKWDLMELKFGKLLGEDPKLTLAKIMARKENPDVSYLEVEKSFRKNKGKLDDIMYSIPADINVEGKPSSSMNSSDLNVRQQNLPNNVNINLSRPVMNTARTTAELNLPRPVLKKGMTSTGPFAKPVLGQSPKSQLPPNNEKKSNTPNVALRKPAAIQEDDIEPKIKLKANLYLKMRKDNEILSDVTLQKKPDVIQMPSEPDQDEKSSGEIVQSFSNQKQPLYVTSKPLRLSEMLSSKEGTSTATEILSESRPASDTISDSLIESSEVDDDDYQGSSNMNAATGQRSFAEASSTYTDENSVRLSDDFSRKAPLLGKPQRVNSSVEEVLQSSGKATVNLDEEVLSSSTTVESVLSAEQEEYEGNDWRRAELLLHSGERTEVELVSCSGRGFVVSFGSLVGFLPYRNLSAKWKFLAFESWLRQKGLDPTLYRQNLSIMGNYDVLNKNFVSESNQSQEIGRKGEETAARDMKFEDLLHAYDQDKTKFLSSFVGQRIKVTVTLADRNTRRLMFSGRPKEKEELVEKKRNLMAKLSVGDVVKCCVKKITYFGIFVEVEGVPALVHQSEVSWDASLDPSSYYKIGQMVEARVQQLDFALERIFLSLKEISPDPLMGALESVIGDQISLGDSLEAAQEIEEWVDVESLIKELQQINGVQSVSKGRFFLSQGLAPTFQVYMGSVFDNQYKLLARYGNKVQEVLVQSSLDKEEMKAAILTCTNRVE